MTYRVKVDFYDYNTSKVVAPSNCYIVINGTRYSGGTEVSLTADKLTVEYQLSASSGYDTFYQWRYSNSGGYSFSTSSSQTASITPTDQCYVVIFCQLKGATYQITYDSNYPDGTHDSKTSTYTYGRQATIDSSRSHSGYDFVGWRIGGSIYAPGSYADLPVGGASATGVWQESVSDKYSIFYYYENKDKGVTVTTSVVRGVSTRLNSAPSYSGYTFLGWEIDGVVYPAYGSFSMPDKDVKAYGRWKPNDITLYFGVNGGTPMIPPMVVQNGVEFTMPSTVLTKSGNTFYGWDFNSSYYPPGEKVVLNTDSTSYSPYAQFTNQTTQQTINYSVSSSSGEITGVPSSPSYDSWNATSAKVKRNRGDTYSNPPYVSAKPGYVFAGWYENSGNTYRKILPTSKIANTRSSPYVYAVFYRQQTLRFSPNGGQWEGGGSSSIDLQFLYGDTYSGFPRATRSGYAAHGGWFTENYDGGIEFREGQTCQHASTSTETKYVYARWGQIVTFNANGGTTPESSREFVIGGKYENLPTPTWIGHDFLGWFDSSYSSAKRISDKNIVTRTNSRTIYAQWKENAFIAIFHKGSGYFKDGSGDAEKHLEFEVGSYFSGFPLIGRNGFTDADFAGWFDSNGNQYREGDRVQKFDVVDLYPKWNGYNIQYYARPNDTCHFDDYPGKNSITLDYPPNTAIGSVPTVYRDDADRKWFDGWYENETRVDATKIEADYVITKSNVSAYARWAQKVTFDANGGQFAGESTTAVQFYFYGYNSDRTRKTFGSFPTPPTRDGITFKGWFTERNGGQQITESSQVEEYAEKTYYAHWSIISVRFIADQSGCSFPDGTKEKVIEFKEGEPYGTLPTVVRTDGASNPFMGWYRNYPETRIKPEDIATVDVYEARSKWELKVTFKANGGTFGRGQEEIVKYFKYGYDDSGTSRYYTYKDCGGFPTPPTRPDYEFLGWYKGNSFHPNDPSYNRITEDENVINNQDEIWAHWKFVGLVTLTFDPDGGAFEDGSTQPIEIKAHVGEQINVPWMVFDYPSGKVPKTYNYMTPTGGVWYTDGAVMNLTAGDTVTVENKHAPSASFSPIWVDGYTLVFFDDDGTCLGRSSDQILPTYQMKYEGRGNYFIRTDKPGKQFLRWNPETPAYDAVITSHQKYVAVYEPRDVQITFIGFNNEVLKEVTVKGGQAVSPPSPPVIANYSFIGWNPPDFSPAVNTMEVRATYKGKDCAIRFIAQGEVIYNTTAEYGGYVTDFPPNPEYEEPTTRAPSDDPPTPPPPKSKKVFKEWQGADEIVTGDKDLIAVFQDAVPVADRDFGGDVADYLFVKPPDDFKNHSPKGDPMPKRVQRADGTDKILRWEDPILLDEWASEFIYLYNFIYNNTTEEPNPTDCPHANDRMVKVSRLIGNVYDETTHYSGSESDSIMSGFFRALSDTSSKAAKGGNGGMYNFYKASKLSPLSDTKLIQSGDRREVEFAKICFGFATDSGSETTDKSGILCDAGSKSSAEGGYFTKYCLPYRNYSKEWEVFGRKPPPISKNIPLTMYAILQAVSGCVVLCSCHGSETSDSEYDRSEWNGEELTDQIDETEDGRDVKPNVGGGGSYGWVDPNLPELKKQYPDEEEWSKIENNVKYYPDTKGTRKPYYKLTKPDGSSEEGTGVMGDGGSSVVSTKTTKTGTYVSRLAYMRISEDSRSEWKSIMKSRSTGYSILPDFNSYGEGQWYISNSTDQREQYMPYTTWRRYTVEGEFETCTKFRFKMGSSIVRNHTKSGQPGSHGTFLNPSKFFAQVGFSVSGNKKESQTYNSEHSYPLVPDITANGKVVEYDNTKDTALVPFEASLVGYDDTTKQCIWECTDVASIIDAVVDKYKILKQWDEYAKDGGPGTARGKFMVDVPIPASSGTVLNATSERFSCKGNCSSSAALTITINLSRIYGAFIWTPWVSANLPSVVPSD